MRATTAKELSVSIALVPCDGTREVTSVVGVGEADDALKPAPFVGITPALADVFVATAVPLPLSPTDFRQVLVEAANSVVAAVGLNSPRSIPAMSAPMSTKTPALMFSSADTGTAHVWFCGVKVADSLRITSGMEMDAPATAFTSNTLTSGSFTPASTFSCKAAVMLAGRSTVMGRREAEAPLLEGTLSESTPSDWTWRSLIGK